MSMNHQGIMMHDVARLMRRYFEQCARAQDLGLTRSQAAVLATLARREGTNQATLAQLMEVEPITLVRLLDRLQAAGFIERRPDPQDRRAWVLFLTPQARPMLERIRELANQVYEDAMVGLSEADREIFQNVLVSVKNNLCGRVAKEQAGLEKEAANG